MFCPAFVFIYKNLVKAIRGCTLTMTFLDILADIRKKAFSEQDKGFRKTLQREFSSIYIFNLRGNCRTSGELRQREGGGIFGLGSRTPIAVTILVKKPNEAGSAGSTGNTGKGGQL
jgi:predicted helicase